MQRFRVLDERIGAGRVLPAANLALTIVIKAQVVVILALLIVYGVHHWF